ncbi:2-amino-4-hydroxy-6-hydroxymethyldihydropteridine diphosphokinase [Evansella tamaricis]|uniref:2-amino-4-hydroxy-6-hydroxymethyldihydropteridine diphosphokinase n=1 Tax=Evansella tamaricis TaxID=2069301 RepID=A0ABS6J9Y5_9BACI|nr:2-amino-4-hydroxy-6-hydroxymethyldihydropteridine diphosphokinase [Evansella tamaricis]
MKIKKKNTVYLSLGSNIGDRHQHLMDAIEQIKLLPGCTVEKLSSVYETDPVGFADQTPFLNMVIKIETSLQPEELLNSTQKIEEYGGRTKTIRWGPRTIDLDILLYNNENIKLKHLEVPHPRMFKRGFVLIPLKEIEPNLIFSDGKPIERYIEELSEKEGVRKWRISYGEEGSELSEN